VNFDRVAFAPNSRHRRQPIVSNPN